MNYDTLETELVGVVQAYLTAQEYDGVYGVRQMPENQTELLQDYDSWPGGLVNIQYSDSEYGQALSTSMIEQIETVKVCCFIQANKMKGATGGYKLLDCVKRALLGYWPSEARSRMYISSYGDWRIEDGEMKPYLEFSFDTIAQQIDINSMTSAPHGFTIDSANSVYVGGPLSEVDVENYGGDVDLGKVIMTGMKKIITVGSPYSVLGTTNISGVDYTTLMDPFFLANVISEIRSDKQFYIAGVDFIQVDGGVLVGLEVTFYDGQVLIAEV